MPAARARPRHEVPRSDLRAVEQDLAAAHALLADRRYEDAIGADKKEGTR